jgi:signal recognition particle subunit SRP54
MADAFKMMSKGGGKGMMQMARMMGGQDMARLQSLGGGKLAQQDPNSTPAAPGLPGLGGASPPGGLPGLGGLPGFKPKK